MAITDLTDKIIADAKKHADEIKNEKDEIVTAIDKETQDTIAKLEEKSTIETEKELSDNERRIISSASQDGKIELDRRKRSTLDAVFVSALDRLLHLSDVEYEKLISKMLKTLPSDSTKESKLLIQPERKKVTENALSSLKISFDILTDSSIEGGFIIRGKNFEYNYTFPKVISDKKSELEIEIANILFA